MTTIQLADGNRVQLHHCESCDRPVTGAAIDRDTGYFHGGDACPSAQDPKPEWNGTDWRDCMGDTDAEDARRERLAECDVCADYFPPDEVELICGWSAEQKQEVEFPGCVTCRFNLEHGGGEPC